MLEPAVARNNAPHRNTDSSPLRPRRTSQVVPAFLSGRRGPGRRPSSPAPARGSGTLTQAPPARSAYNAGVSNVPADPSIPAPPVLVTEPAVELKDFLGPEPPPNPAGGRRRFRRRVRLSVVLFFVTALSVFAAGCYLGQGLLVPFDVLIRSGGRILYLPTASGVLQGAVYAGCLMAILLAHEMGHFVQALRHRVPATLPFFIPFPISPFGTMGAVIVQDGRRADRRQLFDIAIGGPLAGLVVAVPVLWYGVSVSSIETFARTANTVQYGNPLLLDWIIRVIHGPYGAHQDIALNAPIFAGWVGVFITALNLMPVGQLDGGHILYTLVGRKAHFVAYGVLAAALVWMAVTRQFHYALIVLLIFAFGPKHPPTANDQAPLGLARIVLGWLTLAFIVIGFTPTPIVI